MAGPVALPGAKVIEAGPVAALVDPRERELLEGMGNCYRACGEGFEGTVEMVAQARNRTVEDVRRTLDSIRERYRDDAEYRQLRRRLPEEFPV